MERWVAITGCLGYIGGQTVLRFKNEGYKILGVDRNQSTGNWLREHIDQYIPGEFTSGLFLTAFQNKNVEAVIHIAGSSLVGPSVSDPAPYYQNNVGNTARLLNALKVLNWRGKFVFSSSAATYGEPEKPRWISESDPLRPCSPYGQSKLMAEHVIENCAKAYGFKATAFRYFNACGADQYFRHGQVKKATHLIARVLEELKNKGVFTLYGEDYNTPDGTCIRDYLHVEDIAQAHLDAVKFLDTQTEHFSAFNLGTGTGKSVKEVISACERITGRTLLIHRSTRRAGDPAYLVANPGRVQKLHGWKPEKSNLDNIIRSTWAWYNSRTYEDMA